MCRPVFSTANNAVCKALQRNTSIDFIQTLSQTARIAEKSTPHGAHNAGHSPLHWL
jgi:hypothetical protein